jgi:hypothetical protein
MKTIKLICLCLFCCAIESGCAKKLPPSPTVAIINNYELTVDDFKEELKNLPHDVSVDKQAILEAMIKKELLLQEAQNENLDKNREFMKTIESYWEEALLKRLIEKKTAEILSSYPKNEMSQALENWIENLRKKAKIKINQQILEQIDLNQNKEQK